MTGIFLKQSAINKLISDPRIQAWLQNKSAQKVPFLGYYRRSYATSLDGVVTEHGDGFMLTTINPHDQDETRDIVIKSVPVGNIFDILVGGDDATMSKDFSIGWSQKFTFEPQADS